MRGRVIRGRAPPAPTRLLYTGPGLEDTMCAMPGECGAAESQCACWHGPASCRAGVHWCMCGRYGPAFCRAAPNKHFCTCMKWESSIGGAPDPPAPDPDPCACLSDDHECTCHPRPETCRAGGRVMDHRCVCMWFGPASCRAAPTVHMCICDGRRASDPRGCLSDSFHWCTCYLRPETCRVGGDINWDHMCVCDRGDPRSCRSRCARAEEGGGPSSACLHKNACAPANTGGRAGSRTATSERADAQGDVG